MKESLKQHIFEAELLPFLEDLYPFALSLTNNHEDAEDLVQETFLKAYNNIEKYKPGTNAKAWLFTIMRNMYINEYKKKKKLPNHKEIQENTIDILEDSKLKKEDPELKKTINNSLMSLSEDFRMIVYLVDIEGLKYNEVSEIMGIPVGTVRSRLHRARAKLRKKLEQYAYKLGYITKIKK